MDIKNEKDVARINFKEVVEQCKLFIDKKISQEEFKTYCDKIYFKTYLPIEEKIFLINKIVKGNFYDEENIDVTILQFELYKFYDILIGGYTNIDVGEDDGSIENYNICYSCLGNWMLSVCGIDYQKVIDMLKDYFKLSNIYEMLLMATTINNTSFEDYTKEQKKMFNWIQKNPEILKDIKEINEFSDPITKDFINKITKKTIEDINKKEKNKKNKQK